MSCNYYTLPLSLEFSMVDTNSLIFLFKFNFCLDHYYLIYLRYFPMIFCVPFTCFLYRCVKYLHKHDTTFVRPFTWRFLTGRGGVGREDIFVRPSER
jgi:hypothetical protein